MLTQGESQHQLANSFGIIQIQMEEFLNPSESVKQRVPVNVQLRSCKILVPKVEQVGPTPLCATRLISFFKKN